MHIFLDAKEMRIKKNISNFPLWVFVVVYFFHDD